MKKFDLKSTKISDLNYIEIQEIKKYLMICKFSDRVKFVLHILDTEYNLSLDNPVQKKCETFFDDKMFKNKMFRDVVHRILKDDSGSKDDLSESEWLEIDNNYIKETRRKKLSKLNIKK